MGPTERRAGVRDRRGSHLGTALNCFFRLPGGLPPPGAATDGSSRRHLITDGVMMLPECSDGLRASFRANARAVEAGPGA
ncbi:MAG: hypothetical protein ACK2UO_12860, partial [Caldilineaceae bacterium]